MRVLFVTEKGGYHGGVEQNIADTVAGLRARGHRCSLAYGEASNYQDSRFLRLFDHSWRCPGLIDTSSPATGTLSFSEVLGREQPDVVYAHKLRQVNAIDGAFGRARTVRMVHDHDLTCPRLHKYFAWNGRICHHPAGWRCWLDGAFIARDESSRLGLRLVNLRESHRERRRQHQFDFLLVGSAFMKQQLVINGHNPARVNVLAPVVRMRAEGDPMPTVPTILFVGQLIRGKGVDLLLRALKGIPRPWRCVIAGTGNAEPALRELAVQLGINAHVDFRGWTSRDELGRLYNQATCVAVPSRWPEPFGMVGLEAMHHARPVVAFGVGGIPEWLEPDVTGLVVPEQDIVGLSTAIRRLFTDRSLATRLGTAAQQRARAKWDFDHYLDRLEDVLTPGGSASEAA